MNAKWGTDNRFGILDGNARGERRIAFVSPHCLVDFSNGAATATRDALKLLATQGFQCMAYCGTRLDQPGEGLVQEQLFRRGIEYEVRKVRIPCSRATHLGPNSSGTDADALLEGKTGYDARLIFLSDGNLPVTLFENGSTRGGWFGAGRGRGIFNGV